MKSIFFLGEIAIFGQCRGGVGDQRVNGHSSFRQAKSRQSVLMSVGVGVLEVSETIDAG
jgi:hypothetical protein